MNTALQLAKRIAATCTVIAMVVPAFAQPLPISTICDCGPACACTQCTCGPNCSCQTQTTAEQTATTQQSPSRSAQRHLILSQTTVLLPELTRKLPDFLPGTPAPRGPPVS